VTGRLSKPPPPFISASSLVVQIIGLSIAFGHCGLTFSTKFRTHSTLHLQNYSIGISAEHT